MIRIVTLRGHAMILTAAAMGLAAAPHGAAAAQEMVTTQDVPPPPAPVMPAEVRRPPMPVIETATAREPEAPVPASFLVRVTGAGKIIWSGDVTIDNYQAADLRLTLQQADGVCGARSEARFSRRQTGLTFSIRNAGRRDDQPFAVAAEWTRQSSDCALPGTRTTGIDTTLAIPPGATRAIEGDGGLRIELTRQK